MLKVPTGKVDHAGLFAVHREATAKAIGPYTSGIAAYLLSGVAMVAGSLLKPKQS